MVDPPGKARHCTLMLLAAAVLADCALDDIQKRGLARYSILYADAALEWMRKWRNQLKRDTATTRHARACKPELDAFAEALASAGEVRDYLAAKRQPADAIRADDIEDTVDLWLAINPAVVASITETAMSAFEALVQLPSGQSIAQWLALSAGHRKAIDTALRTRDDDHWYLAADTSADLRPYTLAVAQGGPIGRRVAEINDVAAHLDVLLRIAPVLDGALLYDWLVRSMLALELNSLLDLTLGSPPGERVTVARSLLDLCRADRSEDGQIAVEDLTSLRDSIGPEGWAHVRWLRNNLGAHVDQDLTMHQIHEHLLLLDYPGIVNVTEGVLDHLDAVGANRQVLKLLLIGERKILSWPIDPNKRAPGRPAKAINPGSLIDIFRRFDSPYMIVSASSLGSPIIAGMCAGRRRSRRQTVRVAAKPERFMEPTNVGLSGL